MSRAQARIPGRGLGKGRTEACPHHHPSALTEPPGPPAPSQVVVIRQEQAGQTSVSLLWQEPEQPNGIILEYEIKYYEKVPAGKEKGGGTQARGPVADHPSPGQDKEMQSYSTLKAVTTRATVSGLKPGTRYVFQVRARTSAGCGRFSQAMEVETGKPRECGERGQGQGHGGPRKATGAC